MNRKRKENRISIVVMFICVLFAIYLTLDKRFQIYLPSILRVDNENRLYMFVQLFLASCAIGISVPLFLASVRHSLRMKVISEDFLLVIGCLTAYLYSIYVLIIAWNDDALIRHTRAEWRGVG